ncbi:hypothetical protein AYO20_10264 [Fonsecaea nubica]|uniref:Cytochrome b mRNA-processing protein 4 n=1 Tax=Fonsecaea nubica TaxID=856822 RepID=A0A178CAA8_9EURO|nr:hypothetical protein AYO20_10264 [Fonsecaea nubica]OAL25995.1 hypothetical protein AYO20_10264 [Fonsecaea nubica]
MASRGWMYTKMAAVVTPAEGEVFKRFNPDLQKRNLELREQRLKNNEEFVSKLIEYSKSDKPVWIVAAEAEKKEKADRIRKEAEEGTDRGSIREQMRRAQAEGK